MLRRIAVATFLVALAGPATTALAAPPKLGVKILSATVRGKAIADAEVTFAKEGQAAISAKTGANGYVDMPNTLGEDDAALTLTVKKAGFSTLVTECPCNGLSYALSESLGQELESTRIVLNWGSDAKFLDLHAVYPGSHVFWNARQGADAALDVRSEEAFGPATLTIKKRHPGEQYVLAVHNWSAEGKHGNRVLSNSRARVFVYVGDSLVKSYSVPTGKVGAMWVLFAIDGEGAFHDINNVVDITEMDSIGPYLKQVSERTNFGLPQRIEDAALKRADELHALGVASALAGNWDTAILRYQKALELNPGHLAATNALIEAYTKTGRTAEATWAQRKAKQLAAAPKSNGFRVASERMSVKSSSVLQPWKHYTFDAHSVLDDNLWTSWQPNRKASGGVNEWFELKFDKPHVLTGFEISNGFRLIDHLGDLYTMNNRIKDAVLVFSDGSTHPIHFEDAPNHVMILLPEPKETTSVRLVVKSLYKGTKWNDLAVSEFHPLGTAK